MQIVIALANLPILAGVLSKQEIGCIQADKKYGNYHWYSGMFCFKACVFFGKLQAYAAGLCQSCLSAFAKLNVSGCKIESGIELESMIAIAEDSIDVVMEKSTKVKVVPCDRYWSDLASFDTLFNEVNQLGDLVSAILLKVEKLLEPIRIDSHSNLLVTPDRQIVLVGVSDLIAVNTLDAILISKKGSSQKVKGVVAFIQKQTPELAEIHRLTHRPWRTGQVWIDTLQYKIKRVVVEPDSKLSRQKHFYRMNIGRSLVRSNESTGETVNR